MVFFQMFLWAAENQLCSRSAGFAEGLHNVCKWLESKVMLACVWHLITLQLLWSWCGNQIVRPRAHTAAGLGSCLSVWVDLGLGWLQSLQWAGNGKLAVWVGSCMERSLQPSCAKTADGSIPFSIFKNSGLGYSQVLLFCLYAKCDGLFLGPFLRCASQRDFSDHLLYLFDNLLLQTVIGKLQGLSFFNSWFPIALSAADVTSRPGLFLNSILTKLTLSADRTKLLCSTDVQGQKLQSST